MPKIHVDLPGSTAGPHRLWPPLWPDAVWRSIYPVKVVTASLLANLSVLPYMDVLDLKWTEWAAPRFLVHAKWKFPQRLSVSSTSNLD